MGPFETGEVPDKGQDSVIGDVKSSELGGGGGGVSFFFSDCPSGSFWPLPWLRICSNGSSAADLLFLVVIITVCEAAQCYLPA